MSDRRAVKQLEAMKEASRHLKLDGFRCLVLNKDYMPLSFLPVSAIGWQDAIVGQIQNKYEVLETYDTRVIRTPSMEFLIPSVAVVKKYAKPKRNVLFSKANVFLRDDYTCQYCDGVFFGSQLTFDHVKPRSKGGETSWTNIVAACDECNRQKANKTLAEWKPPSGRKGPKKAPCEPSHYELADKARKKPLIIPEGAKWETYLQWEGPLLVRNAGGSTYQIDGPPIEAVGKEELGY